MRRRALRDPGLCAAIVLSAWGIASGAESVLVERGSPMSYVGNTSDPGVGVTWTQEAFDDTSWADGVYGVGYETVPPGATGLIETAVSAGTFSIYTRARFTLVNASMVASVFLGADYDDGYVAWINGTEVYRSPQMPAGAPAWNTNAGSHESSNSGIPNYGALLNITAAAGPALHDGENVLAIGVWNSGAPGSSDLVVVPRLSFKFVSPVTRGPYLQRGSSTGVVVRWRTGAASDSVVRYGTQPGSLVSTASDPAVTAEHVVALTGLQPDTRYFYSVGSSAAVQAGGDADHFFDTSPVPGTSRPTRLWAIGDSGTADGNARAVFDAYKALTGPERTDVWLMLGDNAYQSGTDGEYQAAVFDMYPDLLRSTVIWPTLGNHDGVTANSSTQTGPYYDIFTLPAQAQAGGLASGTEAYYSFDYGDIHFICLESFETNRSPGGAMMTWLLQDVLATTRNWVIAFWHHPPYSKGSHDSDSEPELIEMRTNALPILEAAGVDLVLAGHSHSYERSFLLDGHYGPSGTLTPAMKRNGGDGRIDGAGAYQKPSGGSAAHEGAVYVVAGSSGLTSGGALNHPAMFLSLNVLGSVVLEFNGAQMDAKFLDSAGVWRDSFSIFKGPLPPPVAQFTAAPRSGPAPLSVSFTDLSANGPSGRAWDFENDAIVDSTQRDPTHSYASPGPYNVRLTAFGGSDSDQEVKAGYVCVTSTDGLGDVDGDGVPDGVDPCPCTPDQPPSVVGDTLRFDATGATLTWVRPAGSGLSNLYRGSITAGLQFFYNHACLAQRTPDEGSLDDDVPGPGASFYYLVTAVNACGEGPLGPDSAGNERPNPQPCP